MRPLLLFTALALLYGGCALEMEGAPDTDTHTGTDTTDTDASHSEPDAGIPPTRSCALVTTSEFMSEGALAVVDTTTFEVWPNVTAIHGDAHVNVLGDRVFIINREGGDSVQELDPEAGFSTLWQESVGPGSNPWQLASDEAGNTWLTLYNKGALQALNLERTGGRFLIGEPHSLPANDELDGRAEPLGLFLWNNVLHVVVQGLGSYPRCAQGDRGILHAFDPVTLAPVPAFDGQSQLPLAACNPRSFLFRDDNTLLIAHVGGHRVMGHQEDDGGLELVDLQRGKSQGLLLNESDLGDRDVAAMALAGNELWLALAGEDFAAEVWVVNLNTLEMEGPILRSDTGGIFGIHAQGTQVWIVDRSWDEPGLWVFDATTKQRLAGPLDTGFPPYDLAFFEQPGSTCMRR